MRGYSYRADGQLLDIAGSQIRGDDDTWVTYYNMEAGETYYFNVGSLTGAHCVPAKTYLNESIAQAKAISRLWIPSGAWNALQKAIAGAQAAADDPNATPGQILLAVDTLVKAIENLMSYNFAAGQGFNYQPGYIWTLLTKYSWNDPYMPVVLFAYLPQFLTSPIWLPIHLLLVGCSWLAGQFK